MSANQDFPLTDDPVRIIHNDDAEPRSYVVTELSGQSTGQLLGMSEDLGEGTPILAGSQQALDVAYGESIYAAAPADDAVVLRVFSWKSR